MSTPPRLAIVGGGLVGAVAALRLARAGFPVVLVEPRPPAPEATGADDLRTVALSPASLRQLEAIGVPAAAFAQAACFYRGMEVWDAEGTGVIRFDAAEAGVEALGAIVPNGVLLAALWTRLRDADVELVTGAGVEAFVGDAAGARLTLDDGRVVEAALVIGADGGRSKLRSLARIDVREEDTGQIALATAAEVERSHEDVAWQRFLQTGPLAFLPLPDRDGRHRVSVVWSLDAAAAAPLREADDATFAAALERAFEARLGRVLAVAPRVAFPLVQVHADRYAAPGLVLVGDAAHVLHPLAGQGVNLGLRDVEALCAELVAIARGPAAASIGDPALLSRYERARRGDNALMIGAMSGLKRLFGAEDPGVRLLRNTGLRWVDAAGPLKRRFMAQALGLA